MVRHECAEALGSIAKVSIFYFVGILLHNNKAWFTIDSVQTESYEDGVETVSYKIIVPIKVIL